MTTTDASTAEQVTDELTGLYIYGIVEAAGHHLPDDLTGLDDAPVELVEHDAVAAVVARIAIERPPGRRQDLMAHSRVVEALAAAGPVVPTQFGSVMADQEAVVEELLAPDSARWQGLLEALTGRLQFNVRATYNELAMLAEVVSENAEVADLRARTRELPEDQGYPARVRLGELVAKAVEVKREQDAALVLELVLPHVVSYAPRISGSLDHMLDMAFLVDDARREGFEDELESLAEAMHERAHMQLVGPVPPYDFVGGDWWA